MPPLGWPRLPLLTSVRGRIVFGFGLLILIVAAGAAALRAQADRTGDLAFWFAVAGGAAGVFLGLATSVFIARSILRPLSSLESAALAVAGGDLEARAPLEGPRELAHLGSSLNQMTESLLNLNRSLEQQVQDRTEALQDKTTQLQAVSEAMTTYLESGDSNEASAVLLRCALGQTESEYGFAGVIVEGPALRILCHQGIVWDDVLNREFYENALRTYQEVGYLEFIDFDNLFGRVITEGKTLLTNEPAADPRSGGLPPGHPPLRHFLGVPVFKGTDVVGMIGVANRPRGYSGADQRKIEILTQAAGVLYENYHRRLHEAALEAALRASEEQYRTLVERATDNIIIVQQGKTVYRNPTYGKLLGYTAAETADRNFLEFVAPEDRARVQGYYQKRLQGEPVPDQYEVRLLTRDGHRVTMEVKPSVIQHKGQPATMVVMRDISERKRAEEELRRLNQQLEADQRAIKELNRSLEKRVTQRTKELRLANEELQKRNRQLLDARAQAATDALTGLANHRAFQERVRNEVTGAHERGGSLGLIMMDIDGFKAVNDSLGHLVGDQLLRDTASTIANISGQRQAYRYGGDEFAVLLPEAGGRRSAGLAERLRRAVERQTSGVDGKRVTVSLGVSLFPETAGSAEELTYGADAAMYWAKSAGKNRVGDWSSLIRQRTDGDLPWYGADLGVRAPDAVAALVAALEAKDPVTSAHATRCSWYALKLSEELGLSEEQTSVVRLASLLHDVGKIAVPDEVLFKPGPLNEEEWAQMKRHPGAALHVLSQVRSITHATPAILHHHEHLDGSGYPDALAGDDIPIASRILLVTDAFDAMTTDRPYRKAMSIEAAIEELNRHSGSQFDPNVVEAFLKVLSLHGARPLRQIADDQRAVVAGTASQRRPEPSRRKSAQPSSRR